MSQRRIRTHEFNSSGELWVPDRERPGSRIVPKHSWSTHQASLIALSSSCSAVNRPVVATRSLRSNHAHLDAAESAITVTVARSGFHISARCAAAWPARRRLLPVHATPQRTRPRPRLRQQTGRNRNINARPRTRAVSTSTCRSPVLRWGPGQPCSHEEGRRR
jgi:hypothetical protein